MLRKILLALLVLVLVAVAGLYLYIQRFIKSDTIRATVEQKVSERLGQPVRIASLSWSLYPKVAVDLNNVSIGSPEAVQLGQVRVVTGLRPLLSRRIEEAEIVLTNSRIDLTRVAALIPAAAAAAPPGQPAPATVTIAAINRIALKDIALTTGTHVVHVDLESALVGDDLQISSLSARAEHTQIRGSGIVNLSKLDAAFKAEANPLDLDELLAIGTALTATPPPMGSTAAAPPAAAAPIHLRLGLSSPAGHFGIYAFRDLATTIEFAPERFALAPLRAKMFGGAFDGKLEAALTSAVPRLTLTGRVDGMNIVELMKGTGAPAGVTGTFGGTVAIVADGADSAALMRTARGTVVAALTNGTVPGLDMVRTLVLAFGKPTGAPPAGSGAAFTRLGGTFALAGGALTSENLAFASRDFDMQGRGSLHMVSGAVDAAASVVLSQDLTAQAGTDLRRYAQQDGRITVPATISGSLDHPKVSPDVASLAKRAVTNEVKRRATDFIGGLFKKKG